MTRSLRAGLLVAGLVAFAGATPAFADVIRYAVLIGANQGERGERALSFAESDAERVAEVLTDLGDVPVENQVLLRGLPATAVRRALIKVNDRIRTTLRDGDQAVLIVYYSGHADATALHLGDERLELAEVEALVRGSAADVRLLVIDACRSGALTRVKGGRPAPPVALDHERLGEGVVFLTSSAAGEDAQESDDIGGSFFTHYFTSGLLGGADSDGDGEVTLGESFAFARDQTIVASSRTLAGTQHPTFRYELRGRDDITLTRPGAAQQRAMLTLPPGLSWLVIRDQPNGRVIAEIDRTAARRSLSLRPGRYYVRGRSDALYEGTIEIQGNYTVQLRELERTAYARLVRKGLGPDAAQSMFAAVSIRTPIVERYSDCRGVLAGWMWELEQLSISPRVSVCKEVAENLTLDATRYAVSGELRVSHAWDLPRITVDIGAGAAATLYQTSYSTRGIAPSRTALGANFDASVGVSTGLGNRMYLWSELAIQTYGYYLNIDGDGDSGHLELVGAGRWLLGIGFRR